MTLLNLLKERSQLKNNLFSGLRKMKINAEINNLLDKNFSFNQILDIHKNNFNLLTLEDKLKDNVTDAILSTISINNSPTYDKNLNNYFERDLEKIKLMFDLNKGKSLDKYLGLIHGLSQTTMKCYADLIYVLCDKEEKHYARKILEWIFDEKINEYTIPIKNIEKSIGKARKEEEIIRHQLLFAALQFKSFEDVAKKWSGLKLLTYQSNYSFESMMDYTSLKSGLFWSLKIDNKFPDFLEYLIDSPFCYLLAQSIKEEGKISINYPTVLLKELDFNNKQQVVKIFNKFSENNSFIDNNETSFLSKSDFFMFIYANETINRNNLFLFINTYRDIYNNITDFSYNIADYIKTYRESNVLAKEIEMIEKNENTQYAEKKYLNDDFFIEILNSYVFKDNDEKSRFLSEWLRNTNDLKIIKRYENELNINIKKFIIKQKIPMNLNVFDNEFNMSNLIKSYRETLGYKKDLSFLLDCNKIDVAPVMYIDKILIPLIEDAVKFKVPFNKVFYKKINLLIESLEDMENKKEIISKIDSLMLKDEDKIKAINRIVGKTIYPTIENLKSNIEKRMLENILLSDNTKIQRKNRL